MLPLPQIAFDLGKVDGVCLSMLWEQPTLGHDLGNVVERHFHASIDVFLSLSLWTLVHLCAHAMCAANQQSAFFEGSLFSILLIVLILCVVFWTFYIISLKDVAQGRDEVLTY